MKNLTGKVAFVTGGSRGMGAAIALRFAKEGADVVITHSGKNVSKANEVIEAVKAEGVRGMSLIADNQSPADLVAALQTARERLGTIDILVNNAGIYAYKTIPEATAEEFDQIMNVNVKAVFVASQYVSKFMKDGGRIITVGSNMADRVSSPGGSLYAMSKSALTGLTKGMARDLGDRRITVNLVQPGPIDTDMNPASGDHAPSLINQLAIKRYGKTEEIAGLVAYLAGAESQFVTGTSITMDGGYSV
jgi:3-oxoacyl-[acyl-carrier protein] reductase